MNERSRRVFRRLGSLVLVLAGLCLLAQLIYTDRPVIAKLIRKQPSWQWIVVGTVCVLLNQLLTILRWYLLVRAIRVPLGIGKVLELGVLAECGHFVMPGANGGDLLKAGAILQMQVPRTQILASTVVDRLSGFMGLLVVGSVAAASVWPSASEETRRLCVTLWATLTCAAIMGTAGLQPAALRLFRAATRRVPFPLFRKIADQLEAAMNAYRRRWPWLVGAVLISCVSQTFSQLAFYFAGLAMFREMMCPVGETLIITPVLFASSAIPLPFGAMGVCEQLGERLFRSLGREGGGLIMLGYRALHVIAIVLLAVAYGGIRFLRKAQTSETRVLETTVLETESRAN